MRTPAVTANRPKISRDPERTRQRILAAALAEFAAAGPAGGRVDQIALRAGVNKRMLYHYFGNKQALFGAVLREKLAEREALLASAPEGPSETLTYWFDAACRDGDWFRLLAWEALQGPCRKLVHEDRRRAAAQQAAAQVQRRQAKGLLASGLDPRHLLLSMIALTAYPLAFPQVTRLVTGRSVNDPLFRAAYREFLQDLAKLLGGTRKGKRRP
jgi:TetR/AcrR family transcriptional regulator